MEWSTPPISDVVALNNQIEQLTQQLQQVQQEKTDLEILLNTITIHSDQVLAEVEQEKTDLEILLETSTEHSTLVEADLQHQVEAERREREQQFQLIAAATPVGLLISQVMDGRILYANDTAGQLLGRSPSTLLNHCTTDFYVQPAEQQTILAQLNTTQQYQGELRFQRADGTVRWGLISLCPFRFEGRKAVLTAIADISDRKSAEESLRIAEAKYRGIFENAVEGIFQSTPAGHYLEVNPAMATIYGYATPAEMLAHVTDIAEQIYVNRELRTQFMQHLETQNEIKDFEYQVQHRQGHTFWVSEWARAIRDESGQLLYYEGSCIDITQRKQQEESLRQQIRELQIEIDQNRRQKEVAQIEQTDYFQWLLTEADTLRNAED